MEIIKTNDLKGIEAPYELNIKGFAKEVDLSIERKNRNCVCFAIINWLKRIFKGTN